MAIQILSDLHLESPKGYDVFEIVPRAPHLALLGDIGNIESHKDEVLSFLTRQLAQFRTVFFVPGNHEAYHSDWPRTIAILRAFEVEVRGNSTLGDFVLLDRRAFQLPSTDTVVLGCSLFSSVPPEREMDVEMGLNDFYHTDSWSVRAHNEAHARDLSWLNAEVSKYSNSEKKLIIFTHWSPTRDARAVDPAHANSRITSAFATELNGELCFKSDKVKLWAFGHTHYNCDFTVEREGAGPLRLLANQRGYYFAQAPGLDIDKTVEI